MSPPISRQQLQDVGKMQSFQQQESLGANRKQRRATIACTACRQSKIKCSGNEPCSNCRRRSLTCRFTEGNNKILVSERYLHDLEKQAYNWQRATSVKRSQDGSVRFDEDVHAEQPLNENGPAEELLGSGPEKSTASPENELSCNIWTSPFTLPTTVFKDTHQEQRNWIWLAPSSPWSLTRRLIVMMTDKLDSDSTDSFPQFYLDGDIYPFAWNHMTSDHVDTSDLPSLDYSLYLFQIVRFRLGQAYRFFDQNIFITHLTQFYNSPLHYAETQPRFWFVQFLVVLALGHAFISRPRNQKDPPGSKYFARAMAAMPSFTSTGKDSLLAIETLALVGLYLYAIDHREAAHVHITHAIRIAQLEGMHTQLPEEVLGVATVARCRNLWWSLYIIDHHVSPSLGLPVTTRDKDITTVMNSTNVSDSSQRDQTFCLQVRLTRMLSSVIGTIYESEKTQLGTFLEITRSILETMANYAKEIEQMVTLYSHGHRENLPEGTRHIILLYHQCVIVATRPLLLSVLKERLEKLGRAEEDWQRFLALPKSLIETGVKSAEKILQIIGDENGLLETFLPFDLEVTYEAALHLTMANGIFPSSADNRPYDCQQAHAILDELMLYGNRVAEARKRELSRIEGLFQEFARQVEQQGLRHLKLSYPVLSEPVLPNIFNESNPPEPPITDPGMVLGSSSHENSLLSDDLSTPANIGYSESFGISSYEFLSIVDQLTNPVPHGLFDTRSEWLSGEDLLVARPST